MCGRYVTGELPWAKLSELLRMPVLQSVSPAPRYNIAPTTMVPVLRGQSRGVELSELRWGLQPSWSKGLLLNAQSEKLQGEGRSYWKSGFSRCVFPATGYYEWQKLAGQKKKQPLMLAWPSKTPLAMAGLWRAWEDQPGGVGVILTTAAAADVSEIHHRMPALLEWCEVPVWLAQDTRGAEASALLLPKQGLAARPVSDRVGKVSEDDPALLEPDR